MSRDVFAAALSDPRLRSAIVAAVPNSPLQFVLTAKVFWCRRTNSSCWYVLNEMPFKQYVIVGRRLPDEAHPNKAADDALYKMVIYAPDVIKAKSKYYYFLSQLLKTKRSTAEVVSVTEVQERNTTRVKNYTVWLRYQSRTGQVNMLKETRATSVAAAVE